MMYLFSTTLFVLAVTSIASASFSAAFVSPSGIVSKRAGIVNTKSSTSYKDATAQKFIGFGSSSQAHHTIRVRSKSKYRTCVASKENDTDEDTENATPLTAASDTPDKIEEPSETTKITSGFLLFSYCIQFLGAFFFCGFLLNLCGFGYTVDFEHGLVIDKIQNIRNEVQFERAIEREERAELRGSASSTYITAPRIPEMEGNVVSSVGDQ